MANIDVSELMVDPDFVDPISIIHRLTTINARGENTLTETLVETVGSVQPITGKELQRLPDALRLANVSSFWVKSDIVVSGAGMYPDLLVFRSKRYQVKTVDDWSNFGEGYSQGVCVVEDPS